MPTLFNLFMKKKLLILLVGIAITVVSSAQITKATLQASGLTCAMCARAVYQNLESLPFIEKVDTDLNASSFLLIFKTGMNVDLDALSKKVQDAGFSVASLVVTMKVDAIQIENDKHFLLNNIAFHFVNIKSQKINGEFSFRLVDNGFVSAKEFKKYSGMTKLPCIKSLKAEACCISAGIKEGSRIYHSTI